MNKGNNGGVTPLHFAAMSGGSRVSTNIGEHSFLIYTKVSLRLYMIRLD